MTIASAGPSKQAEALRELAGFPLLEALYGRRSRRFAMGAQIPDGPLAYKSRARPAAAVGPRAHDRPHRRWRARPAGTTRSRATRATRRTSPTTRAARRAARSRRRRASTPPSSSSPTTRAPTSSPTRDAGALVDPADEEITPELMVERHRERIREALRRADPPPARGALPRGPQHLVRERAGLAARDPGRRPRAARDRRPLLPRAERRLRSTTTSTAARSPASSASAAWSTSTSPSRSRSSTSTC